MIRKTLSLPGRQSGMNESGDVGAEQVLGSAGATVPCVK